MSVPKIPGVFTVSEAAELAKVSASTLRRQIDLGNLRARRIGRCLRVLEPELARWLEDYGD